MMTDSYWIGGTTTATENGTVTYFDYHPNSSGKEIATFIDFKLLKIILSTKMPPLIYGNISHIFASK